MRKILVALDGSKNSIRGLSKAIEMAKEDGAKIIGLNVVQVPISYFVSRPKMKIEEGMIKTSKKILQNAKKRCDKSGVHFDSEVIPGGDAGYDIVKYSKKHKVDTIVIGARGLSQVKEIFLGSVSNYVLHKSKIPVMIVK
jgi:nucleotide-binding universal stress UspA family protein